MAVHLPSDLVSDVMLKADPGRRSSAVAKLQSAAGSQPPDFAGEIRNAGAPGQGFGMPPYGPLTSAPGGRQNSDGRITAYQGFEHMVLRNLFETLLPDESSGSFGGGPSAGVWRSMAADQLAGVVADHGGIGIAGMLDTARADESGPRHAAQWPYFALDSIAAVRG